MPSPTRPIRPAAWREWVLAGGMGFVALLITVRLVELQFFRGPEFAAQVQRQRVLREAIPPRPGDIVDRHGRVLATSITTRSLFLVPNRILNPWEVANQVAEVLGMDADALFEKLAAQPDKQFLWVKRRMSPAEVERIKQLNLDPLTFGFRDEYLRRYPQGVLAAQIIGLRDIDGQGQGGVEQSQNDTLRGKPGWRELVRDALGRVIDIQSLEGESPVPGKMVRLSIDSVLQIIAERALEDVMHDYRPKSCCAVVMSVKTGEILAMASRPTFDPNQPDKASPEDWKNLALSEIHEPGSIFKPLVVGWAMNQDLLKPDEMIHCENGEYRMGKRILHDLHPHGVLSVADILVKSSNIGMAKIGQRLGNAQLYATAASFGLGHKTGIALPGELTGLLRPLSEWTSYSTGSVPMGQELSATPLQMLVAYGALANHGSLLAPRLILNSDESSPDQPVLATQLLKPDVADWIVQKALSEVVIRGTARRAKLKTYKIFGKTGTAQKMDPTTGLYSSTRNFSSFICGGPLIDPQALVIVSVDEPTKGGDGFGGTVAAPAASYILEKTLQLMRLPPDSPTIRAALQEAGATR